MCVYVHVCVCVRVYADIHVYPTYASAYISTDLKQQEGVTFRRKVRLALRLVGPVYHEGPEPPEAGGDLLCGGASVSTAGSTNVCMSQLIRPKSVSVYSAFINKSYRSLALLSFS